MFSQSDIIQIRIKHQKVTYMELKGLSMLEIVVIIAEIIILVTQNQLCPFTLQVSNHQK
jgi:hypothetical protein